MTVSAIKLIQPGEIQGMPEDDTPLLVVMDARQVFQDRAIRLAQLATTHADSAWLGFCAQLAQAQVDAFSSVETVALDETVVQESFKHGVPPISISTWKPDSRWEVVLSALDSAMRKQTLPDGVRAALDRLIALPLAEQHQQAQALLAADEHLVAPDLAPFIGATLQLLWTREAKLVASFTHMHRGENGLCPVCGSHPVASVLRVGDRDGHRYLVCSLCASECPDSGRRLTASFRGSAVMTVAATSKSCFNPKSRRWTRARMIWRH
jgi:FdhE protein